MGGKGAIGLRDSVRRRLHFIDFRLFWDGSINRSDITRTFSVSEQQASSDLARYQTLMPGNISYDGSRKTYVASQGFRPALDTPSARQYLAQLRLIDDDVLDIQETWIEQPPSFATVPLLRRRTSAEILKPICDAIRIGQGVEIRYASLTTPERHWRWIEPHAMVFDSRRWHVRAWCRNRLAFRDFVIPRIDGVRKSSRREMDSECDVEWHRRIEMKIAPNPNLSPEQQDVIRSEYGMTGGKAILETRASLVFYIKEYLKLDDSTLVSRPVQNHLYLENAKDVDEAVVGAAREAQRVQSEIIGAIS